jgi:choline-sulfatase
MEYSSVSLTNGLLSYLAEHRAEHVFLWGHYLDPHAPYWVDENGRVLESRQGYERELRYVDRELARLLSSLEQDRRLDDFVIAVTADHGEELGYAGREGHGPAVFEHSVRVPLLIRAPGCPPRTFETPVSTARLLPTLAALAGSPLPSPSIDPNRVDEAVVSEAVFTANGVFLRSVRLEGYKLIVDVRNGGRLLFDLEVDPLETHDLYGSRPDLALRMEGAYQRWLDTR